MTRGELRAAGVGADEHEREFVAAEPRHGVGLADLRPQARSDLLQQRVADVVTERVVDLLEMVEIHHQQAH